MHWFIETIMQLMVDGITYIADAFGNSIIGLLTVDVGSGKSFFDLVFSSIGNFYQYFVIISIAFLLINFVWQLSKMMFLSQGSNDTPLSLTAWTIIAGCLIYAGQKIIYIFEGFFNIIYGALLNANLGELTGTNITFTGFFTNASHIPVSAEVTVGIGKILLTLLLLLMLVYQYIMFLIEIAERYIVLGVLYYTCPFAFSMLGSRSTSHIFSAWVRMIGSQLFLMLCNVIFLRLFIMGMNGYDSLFETYKQQVKAKSGFMADYHQITIFIVWILMMHGILAIGTRVDSYLNTLGLSAAQTGRGLAGAIVASAMGVRRALTPVKDIGGKAWNKHKENKIAQSARQGKLAEEADTHVHTDKNGNIPANVFKNAMDRNLAGDEISKLNGAQAADSFIKNSSLSGTDFAKGIEKTSFTASEDGTFHTKWTDPNTGKTADIDIATLDSDLNGHTNIAPDEMQGRMFTMMDDNGNKIQMLAAATGDGADAFNSFNPAMEEKMKAFNQQKNCSAEQVAPGVWQTTRTDDAGNVLEAKEYSSANIYSADSALNSVTEQIGDMSYNVSDISKATTAPAMSAADPRADFDVLKAMGDVSNVRPEGQGAFSMDINGKRYMAAASAMWDIPANAQNVQTMYASSNGAEYKLVAADQMSGSFIKRGVSWADSGRVKGVFSTAKKQIQSTNTPPHNAPTKPPMYRAAENRANNAKK